MDMQGTDAPEPMDPITEQIMSLDSAIKTVEETLAEADKSIDKLITQRGKIAGDVQHLWNKRHRLKEALEKHRMIDPYMPMNPRFK